MDSELFFSYPTMFYLNLWNFIVRIQNITATNRISMKTLIKKTKKQAFTKICSVPLISEIVSFCSKNLLKVRVF